MRMSFDRELVNNEADIQLDVAEYIKFKGIESDIKPRLKELNTKIKQFFENYSSKRLDTDAGSVTISYRTNVSFNEEKLLDAFRNDPMMKQCVKTKEYIDYDVLESLMYHEEISKENLDIIKENRIEDVTPVLKVSKKKGE